MSASSHLYIVVLTLKCLVLVLSKVKVKIDVLKIATPEIRQVRSGSFDPFKFASVLLNDSLLLHGVQSRLY
jgi:hypothetical protein